MIITLLSLLAIFVGLTSANVSAASANISRSYSSTTSIPNGSIVSLVGGKTGYVEASNIANSQRLTGVVVNSDQSLVAVNPSSGKVQVATDGTVNVLVSNVNGNIKVGQEVAVSPFNGIGMQASTGDKVIGTALTSFNGSTLGSTTEQVRDSSGSNHQIVVGYIRLSIGIGAANASSSYLQTLQQFIGGITGHYISIARVIISLAIAFAAIISIVTLIYAAVYGSIISIGRNPLAKYAVFRTLTSIIGMVMLIAGIGSLSLYLLLY